MSAAVPVFAWMPRIIEGRLVWLTTVYRVYRGNAVGYALTIPADAL